MIPARWMPELYISTRQCTLALFLTERKGRGRETMRDETHGSMIKTGPVFLTRIISRVSLTS